ncbi:hypothetical protein [Paramicrobacterium fandaimingii]|uniref:hypothetical protein n=1 Tax=Paramicrobacterium fandaimingii TaxID=2708079 RepID=UPI00141FC029|nr:hypothetical protein [Microbacterium fandaimingii]
MHGFVRVLSLASLICAALVLGLTLTHVLQAPGSRTLSGAEWLAVQHTFYGGFAIVGGIAEVVGLITSATLAVISFARRTPAAAVAPLVAALCFLGTLLVFWFGNRPVNAHVAIWTPATLPSDWSLYRDSWETAHALSAGLGAIAFLALAIALIWRPARHDRSANG